MTIRHLKNEKGETIGVFDIEDISNVITIEREGRLVTLINPKNPQAEEIIYDYPVEFVIKQLFIPGQQ